MNGLAGAENPIRFVTDERLDFLHSPPLRKSYFIASSFRCGSQYFCWRLWQTGVLGAPCEYFNPGFELRTLKKRLKVFSNSDYISKILQLRVSSNGVFGLKAHYHQFDAFLKTYPGVMDDVAPVTYITINRQDKVAQAVSMAKALQTGQWTSRMEAGEKPQLQYDRETIAGCLVDVEEQDLRWKRWFGERNITPFQVTYESLTADPEGVVRSVVELLGVENDTPDKVDVPPAKKQGDETNEEWIERFNREASSAGAGAPIVTVHGDGVSQAGGARPQAPGVGEHFVDRYPDLIKSLPTRTSSATGFVDAIRLRRRYDAIISQNRALLANARVLDISSAQGFWSLAALDAGAEHVVGIEASRELLDVARKMFSEYRIKPSSFRFVPGRISDSLDSFEPHAFDVVLCKGYLEQSHSTHLFRQLSRLKPKHIILDTRMAPAVGPTIRFSAAGKGQNGRDGRIVSTPNHETILLLSAPDFRWRLIDWQEMGITDWTGVQEYARDARRTYVLDRQP